MNMGNWTKMTVIIGGTGDITLGAVTGFPTVAETIGTGLSFYYAFLNTNLSPIEIGNGKMLDAITLQRDVIEATMVAGVYADDGLTAANIPAGALLFTAPTKDMLIDFMLQMPLRDYGNVTGATEISLLNKAIKINCTGNTTITFADLPPAGTKSELTLHATSANAGIVDNGKGYLLTLPSSCKLGKNNCHPIPLLHDAETVLTLITVDAGTTWQVILHNGHVNIYDMGTFTEDAAVVLDVRHLQSKAVFDADTQVATEIAGVSPSAKFSEPAHFVFLNTGSVSKTFVFNDEVFTIMGSTINNITVPIGYKFDFTVRKNTHAADDVEAYDVWVNGINYNVTASGLSTIFNPSDAAPAIILSNSNKTVTRTGSGGANYSGVRAFGGKNSGKWRFSVRCDGILAAGGGGSISSIFQLGIAAAGVSLSQTTGLGVSGGFIAIAYTSSTNAALNAVYGILVDFELNKIWGTINVAPVSGDPEAGTGGAAITDGTVFFPSVFMKTATSGGNAGLWTAMNEIEDPFVTTWPSFKNWTA